MAAARSPKPSSTDDDEPAVPRPLRRYKVPTTAMVATSVARYRLVSKKGTTTTRVKKAVAKKAVAKKTVAKKTVAKKTVARKSRTTKTLAQTPEPKPRKRTAVDRANDPPPATGIELITRVTSAIERELNQIELIVGGHHIPPQSRSEAERRARTLASLARTLAVITQLRAMQEPKPDDDEHDAMPRDLDEFRDTLARRLEKLIAEPSPFADGEPEPE